jgi:hypothetical protein
MAHQNDPILRHRRDLRVKILGPIIGATLFILSPVVILSVLLYTGDIDKGQLTTVSAIMAGVCVLFPLVTLMAGLDFVMIMLIWGTEQVPGFLVPVIRWLRKTSQQLANLVQMAIDWVSEPVIFVEKWLTYIGTFLNGLVNWFETYDEKAENE